MPTPEHKQLIVSENDGKSRLPVIPDYIAAEMFLENCGFFTPSSTGIKVTEKEKILAERTEADGTKRVIKVSITANAKLGLPITSDLDYYRAFLKIFDEVADRDGHVRLPVRVPSKRLAELAGKQWGGKTRQDIGEWFERMNFTGIKGGLYRAKVKNYEDGFSGVVFSQVVRKGDRLKDGTPADTNYVWPSPWFLSNYYYRYVRPFDHNFHRRLTRPISKALYPLLETGWYAANGNPYKKNYHDLCSEFLLTEHRHLSDIKRQLNPAHEELVRERFLYSWEYREGAKEGSYIIEYKAGPKFFEDQKAKKDRRILAKQINQPPQLEEEKGSHGTPSAAITHSIIEVTGDPKSLRYYVKLVRSLPEGKIFEIISLTKQAKLEGQIRTTPARFFTDLAKRALKAKQEQGRG